MNYLRGEIDDKAVYDGHRIWEGRVNELYSDRPGPLVREVVFKSPTNHKLFCASQIYLYEPGTWKPQTKRALKS